MRAIQIATAQDEDCGISTYTSTLMNALDHESVRVGVPLRSLSPLPYVEAARELARTDGDVIHLQHEYGIFGPKSIWSWLFLPLVWLVATMRGLNIVITLHSAWSTETISPPLTGLKTIYVDANNALLRWIGDEFVFLAEQTHSNFELSISLPADQVTIVSHGVPTDITPLEQADAKQMFGYPPETPLVVEPGFVRPQKGYDTFLEIARLVNDVEFLIAGGVQDHSHTEYMSRIQNEAPSNVHITGVLPEHKFHAVFSAADIALLPYEAATQSGIVNWCIAYGVPIIGSTHPYFQELSQECDGVKTFTDPANAAQLIEELTTVTHHTTSEQTLKTPMEQALAAYRESHSFEESATLYEELYRKHTA